MQKSDNYESDTTEKKVKESLDSICKYKRSLIKSLYISCWNDHQKIQKLCRYIISEQNELNINECAKDTLRGGKGANLFNCGMGFDVIVDFDPQNGDTRTNDCEVVNVVNH